MLKAIHISKKYRKKDSDAVHDFSYEFKDHGLYLLTGASGSGKSTLLNILSATDLEYSGRLYFDATRVGKKNSFSYRNNISSMCFQELNLIPALTVEENLRIAFELAGKEYTLRNASDILRKVNLPDMDEDVSKFLLRNVNELSGGQRQRVAVCRCLVKDARILFCDEPTASLDEKNAASLAGILAGISKDILVIVATHSPSLFKAFNPIMLSMEYGVVSQSMPVPEEQTASISSFGMPRKLRLKSMLSITRSFFRKSKLRLLLSLVLCAVSFTTFSAMSSALMMDENQVLLDRQLMDGNNLCIVQEQGEISEQEKLEKYPSYEQYLGLLHQMDAHPLFSISDVMHFSQSFSDYPNGPITRLIDDSFYFYKHCALELWEKDNPFIYRDARLKANSSCHKPRTEREIALSSFYADALMKFDAQISFNGRDTVLGPFTKFDDVNQLIGQDFHGMTITDIYSTKDDEKIAPLLDADSSLSEEEKLKIANNFTYGAFLFVAPGFLSKVELDEPIEMNIFAFQAERKSAKEIKRFIYHDDKRYYRPRVRNFYMRSTSFVSYYIKPTGVLETYYLFLSLTIVFLFLALVSLLLFFLGNVKKESYILGILNSMGISKKGIFLMILTESSVISAFSFLSSLVMIMLVFGIIDLFCNAGVLSLNWTVLFSLVGVILLIDFLVSLFTYFRAVKTNPRKQLQDVYS